MVLLDGGGHDTADAYAVTAHDHGHVPAGLIQHPGGHGFAVLRAQLEYMPHLDTALDLQRTVAVGAGVALLNLAQVLDPAQRAVPLPVRPGEVEAVSVGATAEVRQAGGAAIDNQWQLEAYRPQ